MDSPISPSPPIPITVFQSVRDNHADDVYEVPWPKLVDDFLEAAAEPCERKEKAWLFSPCAFSPTRRAKKNILRAAMVVLDVDGTRNAERSTIAEATATLARNTLAGIVCTTASHTPDQNRFRVLIPLSAAVSGEAYTEAFHGLDALFGGVADTSKQGCESLFYFPASYRGVWNEFIVTEGATRSAAEWAALAPAPIPPSRPVGHVPGAVDRSRSGTAPTLAARRALRRARGTSLFDCPFVTSTMINDYRTCARADNWHTGMYSFMCSVAARANRTGCQLTAEELADLAQRLDDFDGRYYPNRDFEREADNALSFVAY